MNEQESILSSAHDIVLHNWPSRDVPDTLVKAGFAVTVYGGPEPEDISVSELHNGEVVSRRTGVPPTQADIMYVFPWPGFELEQDLPGVVTNAQQLGATALWYQSGREIDGSANAESYWLSDADAGRVSEIAKAGGLTPVHADYIARVARAVRKVG